MSVLTIRIDHPQAAGLDESGIRKAAAAALEAAGAVDNVEAALILTGDAELRRLNWDFRGVDQVTDVLAFPDGSENPENGLLYLGDVVIAYPFAALQAHEAGYSPGDEIQLLVVHGLLHLLGYVTTMGGGGKCTDCGKSRSVRCHQSKARYWSEDWE